LVTKTLAIIASRRCEVRPSNSAGSRFNRVQRTSRGQDLDTARVNELPAKVNLRIALAERSRIEGTSLGRYQVKLE
jgi:hypothetical protein